MELQLLVQDIKAKYRARGRSEVVITGLGIGGIDQVAVTAAAAAAASLEVP